MSQPHTNDITRKLAQAREKLIQEIGRCVIGQSDTIELLFLSLLCEGHVLLLGVPGVGKTLLASTLAKVLNLQFQRIQFTPDLMPGDITGSEVIEEDPVTRRQSRFFVPGPIFTNFLLADEINRTAPKTQSALLQAMQEREVTAGRQTLPIERPFLVVATQNPIEQEGTYPLPEAQLDRFMFCIRMEYPTVAEEMEIVRTTTGIQNEGSRPLFTREEIMELQTIVRGVPVADDVISYAARLVSATRPIGDQASPLAARYVNCGASPRATQSLVLGGKARALLHGRLQVDFADIQALAPSVLRHRLLLNYRSRADQITPEKIIVDLLSAVPREATR
ncbi:MAG: MoxR family ATPase [Verrucomicrobiaceae bacterium]|nr:MAG: MoxR family ATPase [Verrucomicrobiaceae bacterium]